MMSKLIRCIYRDLIFILVSVPSSPLSRHGHKILFLASVIEGLFGGHGALQSATSAYISDCTSPGSRAYIFSRFAGATFLGIALGPSIGGWLIRHPIFWRGSVTSGKTLQTVTLVFVVAAVCSFLNFMLAALVLPESLSKEKQQRARQEYVSSSRSHKGKTRSRGEDSQALSSLEGSGTNRDDRCNCIGGLGRLFGSLAVFLPAVTYDPTTLRSRKDWSLTILAIGLFGYNLSQVCTSVGYPNSGLKKCQGNVSSEVLVCRAYIWVGGRALKLLHFLPRGNEGAIPVICSSVSVASKI